MGRLQVGEYETVLEVGSALLERREARPFRRDIALSMALAHCGLASAAFDEQAVVAGCAYIADEEHVKTILTALYVIYKG